jgi:hypothetical protein
MSRVRTKEKAGHSCTGRVVVTAKEKNDLSKQSPGASIAALARGSSKGLFTGSLYGQAMVLALLPFTGCQTDNSTGQDPTVSQDIRSMAEAPGTECGPKHHYEPQC